MLTLNFYSFKEKMPKHGEEILYLAQTSSFGYESYDLQYVTAEYMWDDEEETCITYTEGETAPEGFALVLTLDGYQPDKNEFWITDAEYWIAFEKAQKS
jgi:hypothetical protein